jgi:hypothetical protein
MIFDKSDSNESQTIEALVPMVDLFAVLAIVFMIYSNEEIIVAKLESSETIQHLEETIAQIGEAELARQKRREFLAQKSGKSLEQIKEERERKAQELVMEFTKMLADQQSQAAREYEDILTSIEYEHQEVLEMEKTLLEAEKEEIWQRKKHSWRKKSKRR